MAVRVLGPLDTGSAPLSPRERAILAALIVRAGTAVSQAELAEAYWGEHVPATWAQQVKTAVARIRHHLGHDAVETVGAEYRLGIDREAVDATQFERLVSGARQHAVRGEDDRAVDAYRRALAMWRGPAFPDVAGWQPGVVEALRLDEIRRSAEEEVLEARLRSGDARAVIPDAERLVHEDPLREDRWAILALANYQANRQAEALAVLRAARGRLANELGIDPGARLVALEGAVLRQDPDLARALPMQRVSEQCPYRGLEPFGPDDADTFYGRGPDVDHLVDRARPGTIVAIVGPSGSGKSSVLLAGLVPRLAERGRAIGVLRPGSASTAALRDATDGSGRVDVIALDQAEELLRAGGDIDGFCAAARRFVDTGGTAVLTVRSDFLDAATALPHVGAAIGRGVYALGPLPRDALHEAIEEPARRAGLRLEPGLVEVVLRDAEGRPATLPHLSHALQETWVHREGATLTVAGYETAGGITGAIAQSAEDLYRSLGPADRELCRSIMLRLVERTPDGAPVRRRQTAASLLDDPARRRVLEHLARARLVSLDGDSIAIAHEAVGTAWPRLEGWLADEAEGGRLMAGLATAAETWDEDGRPDEDLARGGRLQSLLEWRATSTPDLTAVEAGFLEASAGRERDELRAFTERAARDRRQNRRLRGVLAGAAALLVVALAAGGAAAVRNQQAAASRVVAERGALVSTSLSLRATDRDTAALLAAEAYRRWPDDPGTRSALMGTVTAAEGFLGTTTIPDVVGRIAVHPIPGARSMVVSRASGELEIRDIVTGELQRSLDPPLAPLKTELRHWLDVSADGSTLLVLRRLPAAGADTLDSFEPSFYDLRSGRRIGMPLPVVRYTESSAISPDGSRAAWVGYDPPQLTIAETATGMTRSVPLDATALPGYYTPATMAFAPDGALFLGTSDGRVLQVDPETLATTRTMPMSPGSLDVAMVVPGDGTLVASGQHGLVRVDLATGRELWHQDIGAARPFECAWLAVSPAHGLVFCGDYADTIERRSLSDGQVTAAPLILSAGGLGGLALVDQDTLLGLPTSSFVISRWRIDGGGPVSRVIAPGLTLVGETYDPTGRYVIAATPPPVGQEAVATPGAPYSVWDTTTGERVLTVDKGDGASWLGPGRLLVSDPGPDGVPSYRIVDVATGRSSDAGDLPDGVDHWARSPDGTLWFQTHDSTGYGLDAYDGTTLARTGVHLDLGGGYPYVITFTPDGGRVAVTTYEEGAVPFHTYVFDTRTAGPISQGLPDVWDTQITPAGEVIGVRPRDIAVYDGSSLQRLRPLPRAAGQARSLHVSDDGRTLLAWTWGAVAVWLVDLRSGAVLGDGLASSSWPYFGAALRPDGREFAYTVAQGIAVWDLDPAHQYQAACRIAGRELTADEWATYLADLGPQRATCADVLGS
jgi:DNA-binding SARP family transcriptional activator